MTPAADWKVSASTVERAMDRAARAAARRGAAAAADKVRTGIVETNRIRSGAMLSGVKATPITPTTYKVGTPVFYAHWQEHGRGPVFPVRAKALRFQPKGLNAFVFAKRVAPDPGGGFFRKALARMSLRDFIG